MKICAVICEYNPFHNGHKYLIEQAKRLSGCDAVLCIMSGSFTQRGEAAILPKFMRAEHAVICGADCVIQLPALFSVAPAEIFAQGAISILSSIPAVKCLCFGSENADAEAIIKAAKTTETEPFKEMVKLGLENGESYKRSLAAAFERCGVASDIAAMPNGTLALEYTRAIRRAGADIEILPIKRMGAGYGDCQLQDNYSSASAIRANLADIRTAGNVPECVADALEGTDVARAESTYDALARYALNFVSKEDLTAVFGCTEGLENKLKAVATLSVAEIINQATGRRYTSSRIRRILTANLLGLRAGDAKKCIACGTYIKPLAVKKQIKDELFAELARSSLPMIIKQLSLEELSPDALNCYRKDAGADFVRALIYGVAPEYDFTVKTI